MCPISCLAFTGPYSHLESAPSVDQIDMIPLFFVRVKGRRKYLSGSFTPYCRGPMLQAMERTQEGSMDMGHFQRRISEIVGNVDPLTGEIVVEDYDDFDCGSDIIDAVRRGDIKKDDILLMYSIDGAQLFKGKKSDCWIYIWVILNLSPDKRYKKRYVMPGGFIPGPNAPKDTDSFVFPGLHHVSALQREGLKIWKASTNHVVDSRPYLVFVTADGVGMTTQSGLADMWLNWAAEDIVEWRGDVNLMIHTIIQLISSQIITLLKLKENFTWFHMLLKVAIIMMFPLQVFSLVTLRFTVKIFSMSCSLQTSHNTGNEES